MKDLPVSAIIAIVFGVLVLLFPNLSRYFIAVYLILVGVMQITKR